MPIFAHVNVLSQSYIQSLSIWIVCRKNHKIFAIPMWLTGSPAQKAVFTKDRYIGFFDRFEKEDEHWHKKWSRITTLFCVGAVLMFVGGIGAMILIDP